MKLITGLLNETARALLKHTNLYQNAKMAWRKIARRPEEKNTSSDDVVRTGAGVRRESPSS
jgi:hypothetical protein